MQTTTSTQPSDTPPRGLYDAGDWLRGRHPLVDQLARRIAGDDPDWLDEIAGAIRDTIANAAAWERYEREHRPPNEDGAALDRWEAAGPANSDRGIAYAVMSGGEVRIVRLLATLAVPSPDERAAPWCANDLGGWDGRGVAIFTDWLRILRRQVSS